MGYNILKIDSVKAIQIPTRIKKSEIEKFEISEEDFEDLMRFKKCNCPQDYWEEIVVDKDENFNDKSTIYYHCSFCSEDFAIVEFESNKILYQKEE